MNIYVGNIPYTATEPQLKNLFEQFGEVKSAKIIIDRETNQSKGFGFVEMLNDTDAQEAIEKLEGDQTLGRALKVNQAQERQPRPQGQGFGGGRGGNRGGSGRGGRW